MEPQGPGVRAAGGSAARGTSGFRVSAQAAPRDFRAALIQGV
jgi:hypothetical protein